MHQAIRAAQDLDAFVHRHVLRRRGHIAHQHRHPVLFERIHLEAAGVVRRGQQLIRLHRDAGGMLHHVVQTLQVLLVHLLLLATVGASCATPSPLTVTAGSDGASSAIAGPAATTSQSGQCPTRAMPCRGLAARVFTCLRTAVPLHSLLRIILK
ncbi:hypothetical protein G6F22_018686 [Rhizopus arrhizus]|nr:hypothetical protein G6F22_018686 [Rhizopus arrhizus]KAG1260631.1 hypothetical protein G6F66_014402 [Rhizopus arrhizus]